MRRVAISRIELENVGPWGGRHVFELPEEGLAVFVAPNESGKTTLLRSVAAILWNYRPPSCYWYAKDDAPFRGSLYLVHSESTTGQETSTRRVRIIRDFRTQEVLAEEEAPSGSWRKTFRGKQRQRGRTPDQIRWREKDIASVFAPITAEAFSHVAVISQPWNYRFEDSLVQELIVGPGHATAQEIRDRLIARYRSITRFSRQAGIHSHDGQKPGLLDQLREEAERLRRDLGAFNLELSKLRQIADELARLQDELRKTESERENLATQLTAVNRLRQLRRELAEAEGTADRLEKIRNRVDKIQTDLAQLRDRLVHWPKELADSPLATLEALWDRLRIWRHQQSRLMPEAALQDKKEQLAKQFPEFEHFPPDAPERIRHFLEAYRQAEARRGRLRQLEQKLAELAPRIDRKRQALVAGLVGGTVGILLLILFLIILLAGDASPFSLGGILAALGGVIVSATAGGLAAWVCFTLYRPMFTPAEYPQVQREFQLASAQMAEAEANLQEAQNLVAFVSTSDPVYLGQLAERHIAYRLQLAEWQRTVEEQKRLREELSPERLPAALKLFLQQANNDPQEAEERLRELIELRRQLESKEKEKAALLESLACQDTAQLEKQIADAVDRRANLKRDLETLAQSSATVEAMLLASPEEIDARVRDLQLGLAALDEKLLKMKTKTEDAKTSYARQEGILAQFGSFNAAQAEERLREIERQMGPLSQQASAVRQAIKILEKAEASFAASHTVALEKSINTLMQQWTGRTDRQFRVSSTFKLSWELADGSQFAPAEPALKFSCDYQTLSQGTWDQLALAVRLAVLDLIAGSVVLPVLLDDAFLTWDAQRRKRFSEGLGDLLRQRQLILVTHDENFLAWGRPIKHRSESC
ncbi:MAG: AAA family ATPase [Thermoguttaceae bacterium]|nr:AAA family ATPase [Thermoguttaceae bacterium]